MEIVVFFIKNYVISLLHKFHSSMNSAKIDKNFQDEEHPIFILVFRIFLKTHAQDFINFNITKAGQFVATHGNRKTLNCSYEYNFSRDIFKVLCKLISSKFKLNEKERNFIEKSIFKV